MSFTIQHLTTRNNPNESTVLSRTIFFLILGVAFYLLDRWSLFICDDYLYTYKFGTYEPVRTLGDILESQYNHYMGQNGRFIVHVIVQLFCGLWGFKAFQIIQSAMFVALCALTTRLFYKSWRAPIVWFLITAIGFWSFLPSTDLIFTGNISFAINYLWVAVVSAVFFLLLEKLKDGQNIGRIKTSLLLFVGIFCGSLHESFSIPIAGAFGLYYLFNFKKLRGSLAYLIVGYWFGAMICILAPGNILRFFTVMDQGSDGSSLGHRLLVLFNSLWILTLLLGGFIVYNHFSKKKHLINEINDNLIEYLMLVISFVFCAIIMCIGSHQLFFVAWLLFILVMKQFMPYTNSINKYSCVLLLALSIIVAPIYVFAHKTLKQTHEGRMKFIQLIESSMDGYIPMADWLSHQQIKNPILKKFTHIRGDYSIDYVSLYHCGTPRFIKGFIPYPLIELKNRLLSAEEISDGIFYLPEVPCYVFKTDKDSLLNVEATYERGISKIIYSLRGLPTVFTQPLGAREVKNHISDSSNTYYFFYLLTEDTRLLDLKMVDVDK